MTSYSVYNSCVTQRTYKITYMFTESYQNIDDNCCAADFHFNVHCLMVRRHRIIMNQSQIGISLFPCMQ